MSDEVPKPRRAMGGWGDETADAAGGGGGGGDKPKAGRRAGFGASENDSTANSTRRMDTTSGSRSSNNNNNREKDADDEITLLQDVPTLDMGGNEDITTVVAEAPKVRNNRVQGLAELDSAVPYQLPTTSEEGIDLTLLQSVLLPQNKGTFRAHAPILLRSIP